MLDRPPREEVPRMLPGSSSHRVHPGRLLPGVRARPSPAQPPETEKRAATIDGRRRAPRSRRLKTAPNHGREAGPGVLCTYIRAADGRRFNPVSVWPAAR